jgi:uncharacterized protein YfeS
MFAGYQLHGKKQLGTIKFPEYIFERIFFIRYVYMLSEHNNPILQR